MNTPKYWIFVLIALILSGALVASTYIATGGLVAIKGEGKNLEVKGSAKMEIKSDFVVWSGSFRVNAPDLKSAYQSIKDSKNVVVAYLKSKGIPENEISFSSITTITYNVILPNGMYSNEIESYQLSQNVQISSSNIDDITRLSRDITELLDQGVQLDSYAPQYFYTKLADLKIQMLELAAKDAKVRADALLKATGNTVGALQSAKVGVFQITPLYSNEISDYGINDTSSIDKEITAVVTCVFEVLK